MGRSKGAVNQSEFTVYFIPHDGDHANLLLDTNGCCSVTFSANSAVSACTQVIQDFDPIRIVRVYKNMPIPSLVMGG